MTISEVLALAAQLGVVLLLAPDGEHIQIRPRVRATPELRAGVLEQKAALLTSLRAGRGPPSGEEAASRAPAPRMAPPNTTPVPDILFDELAPTLKEGELRVLLYLIRRTYGFKQSSDQVSLSQFCDGIVTKAGKRLDSGTGLARRHVVAALASLEERGLVRCERGGAGRGHASRYALHVVGADDGGR